MKLVEDLVRVLADEIKHIPKRYIYLGLALYYGLWVLVSLIYIADWLMCKGSRSELLELLKML